MNEVITSLQNSYIKELSDLSKNKVKKERGLFLLEGDDFLFESYKNHCLMQILTTKYLSAYSSIEQIIVTQNIIDKLSSNKSAKGALGVCKYPTFTKPLGNKLVYLDGVQDPGNVGTIIRSALAFSYDAVILSSDSSSIYNDKVLSATKGAIFALPVINTLSLQEIKDLGYQIIVTTLQEAVDYQSVKVQEKFCLVLGNEGQGVKDSSYALSDLKVKIDIKNIDSLNVGVAGGILMNAYR